MAVGGSAASSIFLQLNGRQLFEGGTQLRQRAEIQEDAANAWALLLAQGQCYLRLFGSNLAELRQLHAAWLVVQKANDDD